MKRIVLALLFLFVSPAFALNHGFDPFDAAVRWFESLNMPPRYVASCCGKSDSYAVDRYEKQEDGSYKVWVADGSAIQYPDGTHRIPWNETIPIIVPSEKVNREDDDLKNPTAHSWIFFSAVRKYPADGGNPEPSDTISNIYCFIRHPNGT